MSSKSRSKLPTFTYEKQIWRRGYRCIAGIDEVGRGCFAGPVVAGAVIFGKNQIQNPNDKIQKGNGRRIPGSSRGLSAARHDVVINDSKKLTKIQREIASEWIKENCLAWGVGEASASTINQVGIVKATEIAFRKAIVAANLKLDARSVRREGTSKKNLASRVSHPVSHIDFLLIDAFYIPQVKGLRRKNQMAIVKGDSKSISIAAASILAKVYRD
jgi:ribonuclease HII